MTYKSLRVISALGGAAFAFTLVAQQSPAPGPGGEDLSELMALLNTPVEGASKRKQKPIESPQAVEVLTSDQIRASGAFRLVDLLKLMTNVQVWDCDVQGAKVAIRGVAPGATPKTVQILVDGVPLYNNEAFPIDADNLPVPIDAIERVEVVRGPSSSLYGANAQLGVISIITKRAKEGQSMSFRAGGGEKGTFRSQGFYSLGKDAFTLSAGFGGFSVRDSGQTYRIVGGTRTYDPQDQLHGYQVFVRPEVLLGDAKIWAMYAQGSKSGNPEIIESAATGAGNFVLPDTATLGRVAQLGWAQTWTSNLRTELKINSYENTITWDPLGTVAGNPASPFILAALLSVDADLATRYKLMDFTTNQVAFQANWDLSADLHFVFGADSTKIKATKSPFVGFLQDQNESSSGGFVSMDWNAGPVILSLGARGENETLGGSRVSPRLALVMPIDATTVVRIGYFTSTRSPQMAEQSAALSFVTGRALIPNAEVNPEQASNLELGFRKTWSKWSLDLTAYRTNLKKLIAPAPTGALDHGVPVQQFMNSKTEIANYGAELALAGDMATGWTMGFNASLVDYPDKVIDKQADYSPKATSNLWNRCKYGIFQGYVALQYMGRYTRTAFIGSESVSESADATLQVHYNLGVEPFKGFTVSAYGINATKGETLQGNTGFFNNHMTRFARRELGLQAAYRF